MPTLDFAGTIVQVDGEATRALYDRYQYNWCECQGCTHFREIKAACFPPKAGSFLRQLGIDPFEPMYLTRAPVCRAPKGMRRYEGHYGAIGHIQSSLKTARLYLDKGSWVWADTEGRKWHSSEFLDSYPEFPHPRLLIQFSIILPE